MAHCPLSRAPPGQPAFTPTAFQAALGSHPLLSAHNPLLCAHNPLLSLRPVVSAPLYRHRFWPQPTAHSPQPTAATMGEFNFEFGPTQTSFKHGGRTAYQSELEKARADAACAEKRAKIAIDCFNARNDEYRNLVTATSDRPSSMDHANYEGIIARLEADVTQHKSEIAGLNATAANLRKQAKDKDKDLHERDEQLRERDAAMTELASRMEKAREDVRQEQDELAHVNDLLASVYKDLDRAHNDLAKLATERDHAVGASQAVAGQRDLLVVQLEEHEERIAELAKCEGALHELEEQQAALRDEVDRALADKELDIQTKDDRIAALEAQLQKAEKAALAAQAATETANPTYVPEQLATTQESLADELDEAYDSDDSDDSDDEFVVPSAISAIYTILDQPPEAPRPAFSGISSISAVVAVIDQAPVRPRLAFSAITAVDSAPKDPLLAFSTITAVDSAPKQPVLELSAITAVDSAPKQPVLELSAITAVDSAPKHPALELSAITEVDSAPEQPYLDVSTITAVDSAPTPEALTVPKVSAVRSVIDQAPEPQLAPRPASSLSLAAPVAIASTAPALASAAAPSNSTLAIHIADASTQTVPVEPVAESAHATLKGYSLSWWVGIPLLWLLFTHLQLRAAELQHTDPYGAYGKPSMLFGVYPVGYSTGNTYFSEVMDMYLYTGVRAVEDWMAVSRAIMG
ncbi:hypothetical protein P154DRAFT_572410 [Amniculicola lignicola CBS 123094]|uniref:Uncharacterized protein n=1 Tax=Amniculicola lignicola CBS 123094 TaxID=1392246 RepID=A0A6A5WQZ1_9PLEO|nr:hypothetical protein P154DRAFT_572410 [Amniculicola lignicola CBS 123094]